MRDSALGRRFWTLWAATTATNLGDGMTLAAFPLLAIDLTDDARLVALVSVGRFLPFVVVGLPLGLVVDRFDRKAVVLASQALRGGTIGVLAVVVAAGQATIGLLVGAAFVVGLGEVLTDGASPALIRSVVRPDQLEVANARLAAAMTVSNLFVGPPLGAALFVVADWAPFVGVVVTFVIAGFLMLALPGSYHPEPSPDPESSIVARVTLGLRYVWGHEVLRPLALTVAAFAFLNEASNAVFVILATERYGLGEIGFGLLLSIDALTSIAVSFLVARVIFRVGHAGSMQLSVITYGLAALTFGLGDRVGFAVMAAVLSGMSDPLWNIVSTTIRQRLVPDHLFGRMMTAYLFIAWGIQPLGALAGGMVTETWGVRWVYLLTVPAMAALFVGARPMFAAVSRAMAPDS